MSRIDPDPPTQRSATEERAYLLDCAQVHRQRAENTTEVETRLIHLRLSRLYAEQAARIVMVLSD